MKKIIYEVVMCLLAAFAVVLSIIDIISTQSLVQHYLDMLITIIFIFDYFIRLIISKNRYYFFKCNIIDLISIIPFNSLFKAFRIFKIFKVVKVAKFLKFLKLFKLVSFSARFLDRAKSFFNTNGFKYVLFITIAFVLSGAVAIHFVEGMSISDSIWWSFVTTTTVGYGDISPETSAGRCIAMFLMLIGIGLVGSLTSTITNFFLSSKNNTDCNLDKSTKDILDTVKMQLDDFENLTSDDVNVLCSVLITLKNKQDK